MPPYQVTRAQPRPPDTPARRPTGLTTVVGPEPGVGTTSVAPPDPAPPGAELAGGDPVTGASGPLGALAPAAEPSNVRIERMS